MATYHLALSDNQTEALDSVSKLTGTELDIDSFLTADAKAPVPLWATWSSPAATSATRPPPTGSRTSKNADTRQDVILIAGDPADPTSRRVRLADAWASASYHLDEDDDPDAFVISFADITLEK
ncbi:hypothetical protein ACFVZJ_38210 [Streptomyces sp. NPDC058322]|uniref:hypothetical protein n=1 Tax=Streptomyces sp. NPDC058322 TaxID=3346446 RepID=UPI0036E8F4A5